MKRDIPEGEGAVDRVRRGELSVLINGSDQVLGQHYDGEPALAKPTHRCRKCGALWRKWRSIDSGIERSSWSCIAGDPCMGCCQASTTDPVDGQPVQLELLGVRA